MWCYREIVKRVYISVMFEFFHFQHFEQVSQIHFFCLFLWICAIYCSNSEHSLRMDSVELRELLFFPKGRVLLFLCILLLLLFMCGTVQFQFVSSPKQNCVKGCKGYFFKHVPRKVFFFMSQHPLTLILKQG